jgi:hypothetical protein
MELVIFYCMEEACHREHSEHKETGFYVISVGNTQNGWNEENSPQDGPSSS